MNTPQVGEVWGDPAKPETWRYVFAVNHRGAVSFRSFLVARDFINADSWQWFIEQPGTVRIHAVEDTVDTLLAEVERLTAELAAAQAKIERVNVMEASNPPDSVPNWEWGQGFAHGYNSALADVRKAVECRT